VKYLLSFAHRFDERKARMKTLIEADVPAPIITAEAKLILAAGMKAENDWQLARKIFFGCVLDAFRNGRRDARLWWLEKVRGLSEDEAIEQICKEQEPKC